ncbi:MAG: DUF4118 domain-containing protein, partial [Blastocatellia bacterium]|nr:DUF4118 domain-containing protein [Blastocatellia bacterium]
MKTSLRFFTNYLTAFIGISLVTFLFKVVITEVNNTTVALGFLLVVLLISSTASRSYAPGIFASFFGMLCFNYFFLPPQGTLTIADPQNIVALFSFLVTAIVASHLSTTARNRTADAERKREEVWKLYLLSRSVIVTPDSETASSEIARQVLEIFSLQYCAVFLPDNQAKLKQIAVATELETEVVPYQQAVLENAFSSAELISSLPKNFTQTEKIVYYAPLKIGVKVFGVITLLSSTLDYGTIEAIAGIVALAIERARFLKEVSTTEALRKSDELKAALLASISHNLRTPLTSIRAAVESLLQEDVSWNNDALKEFHLIISE